jgi:DNA segregation ATPase FtsK/SpoIIIE-like protein
MEVMQVQPEVDPLYAQALELIIREQKASKRLFKEKLRIGQTKALQLLDELEQAGKVIAVDERGARKVLVAA